MGDTDPWQMLSGTIDQQVAVISSDARIPAAYLSGTDDVMDDLLGKLKTAATGVRGAAIKYRSELESLERKAHAMPPEGAELERLRIRDQLETTMREASQQMEAAQLVSESHATMAALPRVPKDTGEQSLLRDEARMILDGANEGSIETVVTRLASGDRRDLAGLMASRWGRAYLEARGVENAADVHRRMVDGVALSAANNGHASEREQAASRALQTLKKEAPGLRAAAMSLARITIDDVEHTRKERDRLAAETSDLKRRYR